MFYFYLKRDIIVSGDNMKKENQMYEVEIKSMAIINENKKGFITYFQGGTHEQIISNLKILYPQFMNVEDKPNVNITPISKREYKRRLNGNTIQQKGRVLEGTGDIDEIMAS